MQRIDSWVTRFEEGVLAVLLGVMTTVTFTQVVARYGFNSGWTGALEFTRILFAWLILFGMSYGIKISAHLGVDAFIRLFPQKITRMFAVFAALCGVFWAVVLLYADILQLVGVNARGGAIDYWLKMWKLGIGLDDLRYPEIVQEVLGTQERVQRWIVYLILPIGLALFAFRCTQASWEIIKGERSSLIAAHEAEEVIAENKDVLKD